ncbi:MAG: hypothetical protein AAF741_05810 [Bacteroidota bacterium]
MPIIFLNSHRAKSGSIDGKSLPADYVLAARFFDCGIIDRTHALDLGFEQQVLDEIPEYDANFSLSFREIALQNAKRIWSRAESLNYDIQVLWSGGIDSTVALIALVQTAQPHQLDRLRILLSMDSINEYPLFFRQHILRELKYQLIQPPVTNHLAANALIVTGEHGDQLFGSDKLLPLIKNGLALEPWEDVLPLLATHKLGDAKSGDALTEYLRPLIAAAPTTIHSAFDLYWWLNFTIKWQQVSLRLPVFSFQNKVEQLSSRFEHFFQALDFQKWAMSRHQERVVTRLEDYKLPAKQFIYDYTQDADYLNTKSKEPSLKNVILDRKKQGKKRYRIHLYDDWQPKIEVFHRQFKNVETTLS